MALQLLQSSIMDFSILLRITIFVLTVSGAQCLATTFLNTTQRFSPLQTADRCLDIFVKTSNKESDKAAKYLSEFKLRHQDYTMDGNWWFAAQEIQKHLNESNSLDQLIEKLKNLGEKSKKIRKEKEIYDFDESNFYYNILISVDYIKPLLKFKNEMSLRQKDEILRYLSHILGLPLAERRQTSFSDFYGNESHWETRYINLMMFEAFLKPQRMNDFLMRALKSAGLNSGVSRGADRSGWNYVNPSLVTLLSVMDAKTRAQFIVMVREFIAKYKEIDKDLSLDSQLRDEASSFRRNGEVLLNLLFYPETLRLIETVKSASLSKVEVLEKIDQFLELKNGYKSELDFATLRLIAKEVSDTFSELGLGGDIYIVGSALSGRFKSKSSDFDLIFSLETQDYFKNSFKEGYHGLILFDKPLSPALKPVSEILWQMQKRVHNILKNRANQNIFSSSGISINSPHLTPAQQKDAILFGFSSLSNNFSIRISNGKIFLGIYDPLIYTSYELDITNL